MHGKGCPQWLILINKARVQSRDARGDGNNEPELVLGSPSLPLLMQHRPHSGVIIAPPTAPHHLRSSCGVSVVRCSGRNLLRLVFGNRELGPQHHDGEPVCGGRLAFGPGVFGGPKLIRRGSCAVPFPRPEGLVLQEAAAAPAPPPTLSLYLWAGTVCAPWSRGETLHHPACQGGLWAWPRLMKYSVPFYYSPR